MSRLNMLSLLICQYIQIASQIPVLDNIFIISKIKCNKGSDIISSAAFYDKTKYKLLIPSLDRETQPRRSCR